MIKNIIMILITILITFIITSLVIIKNIKIIDINNNSITIELFSNTYIYDYISK